MEKFNAVGQMRQNYPNGIKVDATGTIFGENYNGAAQFKAVLLRNEREFVQGFTEHMEDLRPGPASIILPLLYIRRKNAY